jgi:hypothetical protein
MTADVCAALPRLRDAADYDTACTETHAGTITLATTQTVNGMRVTAWLSHPLPGYSIQLMAQVENEAGQLIASVCAYSVHGERRRPQVTFSSMCGGAAYARDVSAAAQIAAEIAELLDSVNWTHGFRR